MITKQLIDKIEGEASITFEMQEKHVAFATISFANFRGMESLLRGKNGLDALVFTPRVCGICGHAHLMATVRALEDAYANAGYPITLTNKAAQIREFTLGMEMVQNHLKWIYLTLLPELQKLGSSIKQAPLKAAFGSSLASKAIALLAGQWPHSSYMIPGGITADPTYIEILQAGGFVEELILFIEKELLGVCIEEFLAFESCKDLNTLTSDLSSIEKELIAFGMQTKGFAYDRFVVMGEHGFSQKAKLKHTRSFGVDPRYVTVEDAYDPYEKSYAKNALYKGEFYETGPLARMMAQQIPLIKNIHRRFKDSAYARVIARIYELPFMLKHMRELLKGIVVSEDSFIAPHRLKEISAEGVGVVEAPRGPLLHRVELQQGIIQKYEIITPTQWNIGSGAKEKPTPAQTAMVGLSQEEALFVFRTFDVCSVCTTH